MHLKQKLILMLLFIAGFVFQPIVLRVSEQALASKYSEEASSFAWLVQNSPLIFVGSVVKKDVEEDHRDLIVTRDTFYIEKIIAGNFKKQHITLTTLGGSLNGEGLKVSGMPVFDVGHRYIVFTDPERTTYNPITGDERGVFRVESNTNFVYSYHGSAVVKFEDAEIGLSNVISQSNSKYTNGPRIKMENPTVEGGGVAVNAADLERNSLASESRVTVDRFSELVKKFTFGP